MPDRAIATKYITALTGDASTPVTWQTFDDDKARDDRSLAQIVHGPIDTAWPVLERANGKRAGIFVSVNETDLKGRQTENVTALRALFVDCDGTMDLPTEWDLAPSIIVQRGPRHWHAYWLLQPGEDLERFKPAQVWMAIHWQSDPIKDLTRVLRVPGFNHHKGDPVPVELVYGFGQLRYTIDQVIAAHPIAAWSTVDTKLLSHAAREQIKPALAEQQRRADAAPKPKPSQRTARDHVSSGDRDVDNYRKYCACFDTTEGPANSRGGRDNSAYAMAAEGYARGLPEDVISGEVLGYCERSGMENAQSVLERVMRSAAGHAAAGNVYSNPLSQGNGDCRGGGGGDEHGAPPPPPPADDGHGEGQPDEEPEEGPYDNLDIGSIETRWLILVDGSIVPVEHRGGENPGYVSKINKRICSQPIWPVRLGTDVATSASFWEVAWMTPWGERRSDWVAESDLKDGFSLVDLQDAPVTRLQSRNCAQWLTDARVAVTNPRVDVVSRVGWCGINGSRRWVWPGVGSAQGVRYIGSDLDTHGELDAWSRGLRTLANLPEDDGFTGLAVCSLSAAAPLSRIAGGRNPIIGLMCSSSKGKGSVIDYALSIWTDADHLRLPASSTAKGVQDRAIQVADLPIFLDELQQLAEAYQSAAADALYFCSNGQRRTTSSKAQVAVGGERRHGAAFYAAEAPVLPGQNLGVHFRVIELDGWPCPTEEVSVALQRATEHYGVIAARLSELVQSRGPNAWREYVLKESDRWRVGGEMTEILGDAIEALRGDDAIALALVRIGADLLSEATGVALPAQDLATWLAQQIARQRQATQDRETAALSAVLSLALNQPWSDEGTRITINQQILAWRQRNGPVLEFIDLNPQHPAAAQLMRDYGGSERLIKGWADKGWIDRQGRDLKIKRRGAGRVIRFNRAALACMGQDDPQME